MATERKACRLLASLELFRVAGGREFPIQLLLFFLYVASHDGCRQSVLTKAVGMSTASVSRCLDKLGSTDRHGNPGLHLIVRKQDPTDYKQWRIYLTPKGQTIVDLMVQQLDLDLVEDL
ncbi:transcriptional regulator [Synechococcus phage S-CBP2]|uniref:MarR family transcription regulator n=1 Tax=Synechococcus phage S-CBP2 TaxID=756277 RepID=A0A096VL10_9CAUD|nr:transcriptional regulator [Synechococcus phage S-CBP2]AGF91118.1 hypothetical protein SXHG_00096 [Synechococcus phage MRHenn-2013a]AGK86717.1 MarR family transcription regulator [Synechococcus phage S-CBP2]